MTLLRTPTRDLRMAGIDGLEVHRIPEGVVLWRPDLQRQASPVHRTAGEAVAAARAGERPQALHEQEVRDARLAD